MKAEVINAVIDDFSPPLERESFSFQSGVVGDSGIEVSRFYAALNPLQLHGIISRLSPEEGVYVAYFGELTEDERLLISMGIKGRKNIVIKCVGEAWRYHSWGVASGIAKDIELVDSKPVKPLGYEASFKVVTFVPPEHLAHVREAAFGAGAGRYGQYSKCSFSAAGKGTFLGSKESQPKYGQAGRFEEIQEERLEVVSPYDRVMRVVQAMRKAHPYEEPVIEVYRLHGGKMFGEGRIGNLAQDVDVNFISQRISAILKSRPVYMSGKPGGKTVMIWDGDPVEGLKECALRNVSIYVGRDSNGMSKIIGNLFSGVIIEFPSYCFNMAGARELVYTLRKRSKQEDWGLRTFLPSKGQGEKELIDERS